MMHVFFPLSGILDPVNNGQVPLVPIGQPLNLMVHHPKGYILRLKYYINHPALTTKQFTCVGLILSLLGTGS